MTSEYAEQILVDAVVDPFQPVDIDATKASLPMNLFSRKEEKLKAEKGREMEIGCCKVFPLLLFLWPRKLSSLPPLPQIFEKVCTLFVHFYMSQCRVVKCHRYSRYICVKILKFGYILPSL